MDGTGAQVSGARVILLRESGFASQEVVSDHDGQFSFTNVVPGTTARIEIHCATGLHASGQAEALHAIDERKEKCEK